MARSLDSPKAVAWQGRFRRFGRSGLTVILFCAEEGVSTASFYRWRKRLADRQPAAPTNGVECGTAFRPMRITPSGGPIVIPLPGGVRLEVPAENLDAVRAVLGKLLQHDATPERGGS